jgi:hypothetical protein
LRFIQTALGAQSMPIQLITLLYQAVAGVDLILVVVVAQVVI